MSPLPDPAFLIRRLIGAAERERDALMQGEDKWDDVVVARNEFDQEFARLEIAVQQRPLTPAEQNDLSRLHHLHAENIELARALQRRVGAELAELNNVRKIGGYRPLGDLPERAPRYLDSSA